MRKIELFCLPLRLDYLEFLPLNNVQVHHGSLILHFMSPKRVWIWYKWSRQKLKNVEIWIKLKRNMKEYHFTALLVTFLVFAFLLILIGMLLVYRSYYLLLLAIEKGEKPCSEDFFTFHHMCQAFTATKKYRMTLQPLCFLKWIIKKPW